METLAIDTFQERLDALTQLEPRTGPERQHLERLWNSGKLQRHCESLEHFYLRHKDELQEIAREPHSPVDLLLIAKLLIVEHRVIDHVAETFDQMREIESELWIQGELGNADRDHIALNWALNHADVWRNWRIKEYLYAVEHLHNLLPRWISLSPSTALQS